MTLVDQSRALSKKITISGYSARISADFEKNGSHKFIQELRNDVVHITLHKPNWHISTEKDGTRITKFLLYPHQLARAEKYNLYAKNYLQKNPNGINLGALFAEYQTLVNGFQEWLQKAISSVVGTEISDYLRCRLYVNRLGARPAWNLILCQVVAGAKNPYNYLDQFLTEKEMVEVLALPHQSAAQVDLIIRIIDEYGACDDELRSLVYKAFNIHEEKMLEP
ncbi:hypothetical protein SAMN05216428_101321 [Nitrosospira sp. Nsp11]|nr:hypothetical protein SAMN05216428_101321 [Nitrosospira sp. Nsp11]